MRTVISIIAFLFALLVPASHAFSQSKPMKDIAAPRSACCDQIGDPLLAGFLTKPERKFCIGRHLEVQLGGFTRLDLIHDFDPIGDRYEFVTTSIPTDGSTGHRTTVSARQTRFNLDVLHTGNSLHLFAEGDFFGDGGDFRLRLGYGEIRGVLVGQNWSTFQDESIIPATLDYEGPIGMIFVRQPQLRLTMSPNDRIEFALAIEDASQSDPNVDIPFASADDYQLPDLVARLRYEMPAGHVQVASLLREVGFQSNIGANQNVTGWGASVSGALLLREPDRFYAQLAFGEGFARYIEDLDGISSDAALDANGHLVALSTIGAFAGWNHCWTECLQSNLVYGFARVSNSAGQAPDAFHQSEYFSGNVIWSPFTSFDLGCEALWGNRQDKSRADGEAVRLQFTTTFRF